MNRRLLDPFQSVELPEIIEEYLEHGSAVCMSFNRRGTLLGAGTKQGNVVIWDFDTRGVAAVLLGHNGPVTSVAWSRTGRNLLSGSEDQSIILWDLLTCSKVCQLGVRSPVLRVSLSPHPPYIAVISVAEGPPLIVDFTSQQFEPLPFAGDAVEPATVRGIAGAGGNGSSGSGAGSGMLAIINRQGNMIIGCQLRGAISVVDVASRKIIDVVRLPNSARVVDLVLNRKGTLLLATCTDQRVRMYEVLNRESLADADMPTEAALAEALANRTVKSGSLLHGESGLLRPVRDFLNAVERTPWRSATFSCDSEHVVGVTAAKAQLHIFIWNRPLGNMECILEGPKESALELAWHPLRSLLLSCSSSGRIYIWAKVHAENWSAFAPDFKELDENTEYVEQEDEFDWNTPGAGGELGIPGSSDGIGGNGEADPASIVLDVVTREPHPAFSSDDEEVSAQELLYLPVVIEKELEPARRPDAGTEGEREGEGEAGRQLGNDPAVAGVEGPQTQQLLMKTRMQMGRLAQFPRRSGSAGTGRNGNGRGRGHRRDAAGDGSGGPGNSNAVKTEQEDWGLPVPGYTYADQGAAEVVRQQHHMYQQLLMQQQQQQQYQQYYQQQTQHQQHLEHRQQHRQLPLGYQDQPAAEVTKQFAGSKEEEMRDTGSG
ncbi:hypothetical protein Vretimale_15568 [Volvox reticuliferus]|uniref:Uncharacterized protein n=1 Tax=Volvox reticuliferus TaxID=1737510 RepID=A0A8J4CSS0_9CHLO|nr:hypothetical protein Vretifemale_15065 [Volvox reticuliferus]GIM12151.1 hypothetical protein Vretimale_15568 [Volvox reticuliferus]